MTRINLVIQRLGASNGTDDTTALNSLLAAGGTFHGLPGQNYLISAPLVVPSNTVLDMTGCTVTLKAAANCNMLQNAALASGRTVMDAAITATSATLTSSTAAFTVADVGAPIVVWGAGTSGQNLATTILSLTNATTVVLNANAVTTVSASNASIGARDTSIRIIGGTWARGTNGGSGSNAHTLRFRRVDDLTIAGATVTSAGGKYAVSIADATRFHVTDTAFNTSSDGVHIAGPAAHGQIVGVTGTTGDDTVAITPYDYAAYADTAGSVTDILIERVQVDYCATAPVKVLGGNGWLCKRITVRGVSGAYLGVGTVWAGDDTGSANTTGGVIDNLVLQELAGVPTAANTCQVYLNGSAMKRITIAGVQVDSPQTGHRVIFLASGAVIDSLHVSRISLTSMGGANGQHVIYHSGTSVANLVVDGVTGSQTGHIISITGATGTVTRLAISNVNTSNNGGGFVQATTSTQVIPNVEISNCSTNGMAWIVDLATTTEVHLNSVSSLSMGNGLCNVRATASLIFSGTAFVVSGASNVTIAAGGAFRSKSFSIPVDLSVTGVGKSNGDMAFNTNGALSCGAGPVVANGTNWKSLYAGTTY